jgi:hypothetical protein
MIGGRWKLISVVLLAVLLSAPVSAQKAPVSKTAPAAKAAITPPAKTTTSPATAAPAPKMLTGGVEHSQSLPPVDPRFRPGVPYDANLIPQMQPGNQWYWIPDWFAGSWHSERSFTLASYDLKTGDKKKLRDPHVSISDEVRGFQRDSHGIVWQYKSAPYRRTVDHDGMFEIQLVKVNEPVEVTQDHVIARYVGTNIEVDRATNRIKRVWQGESIQEYYPISPVEVRCNASVQQFGADGKPVWLEKVSKASTRTQPFMPIDIYQGRDLRPMFKDFLTALGHADLVPIYNTPPRAYP